MITIKSYTVVLDDGTTGAMSTMLFGRVPTNWQEGQYQDQE
jgi:hypothetical protein